MIKNMAAAVRANAIYRKNLGWTPSSFGMPDTISDTDFVTTLAGIQKAMTIEDDGIAGPTTYGMALSSQENQLIASANGMSGDQKMIVLGKAAVARAERVWLHNIVDGPKGTLPENSRLFIDAIMRTAEGVGWSWLPPYQGDGQFEWCTTFIAHVWAKVANLNFKPVRYYFMASTDRIEALAHYREWEGHACPTPPPTGPRIQVIELDERSQAHQCRFPDGSLPRAGDIVLVGGVHTGPGRHGVIAASYNDATGTFSTIEGNAKGLGPKGDIRQGVIKSSRRIGLLPGADPKTYHVRRVVRLAPHVLG